MIINRVRFREVIFITGLFFLFAVTSATYSAEHTTGDATVITCPPEIQDLRLNYQTKYRPPQGWGHADVVGTKTKGGVATNVTLVLIDHQIGSRNLICKYGSGSGKNQINLASIKKAIPKGTNCKVEPKYSFRCVAVGK